jgi:hypothetical protein
MMLVDCQTCPVRDVHCADCMVTALTIPFGRPTVVPEVAELPGDAGLPLDRAERRAVSALLAAGLVTADTANSARAVRDPAPALRDAAPAVPVRGARRAV